MSSIQNGSKPPLSKIDILCVDEQKQQSQVGTYNPLHSFNELDIRISFDFHAQLQFFHPQKIRIFCSSGVRNFAVAHYVATRSLDFTTSKKALMVIQELGNIPEKPVMPQDAVRRIFHNLDGATRIVVVTDSILLSEVSSWLYRKVCGLSGKHAVPKILQQPQGVAHLSLNVQTKDVKVIRKYA